MKVVTWLQHISEEIAYNVNDLVSPSLPRDLGMVNKHEFGNAFKLWDVFAAEASVMVAEAPSLAIGVE